MQDTSRGKRLQSIQSSAHYKSHILERDGAGRIEWGTSSEGSFMHERMKNKH